MINIENDIFDCIATAVRAAHAGVSVTAETEPKLKRLPAVTVVEADNYIFTSGRTWQNVENAASVMYEVRVFSDKASSKRAEAKAVMATCDDVMSGLNFTRTMMSQIPNLRDQNIFQLVARYEARVERDGDNHYLLYQR